MSDFEFDPDVIAPLPAGLRGQRAALLGATTGVSAEAVRRISDRGVALAARLDTMAGDLEECLELYAEADDDVFHALELRMAGALS